MLEEGKVIMEGKMKAVVLQGPGKYDVEMIDITKPEYGEVLVKVMAVSICGSDPRLFSGGSRNNGWPPKYPFVLGHEFAGEVVELGEGVTKFKVGDRVAGEAHCGCGICENCMKGLYNLCLNYGVEGSGHHHYGHNTMGCYAQYERYSIKVLTPLPDSISYDEGTMTDTAGTAYNAIRLTGVEPGGYTAVIGPGPMGIFAMQIAKALGSQTIMIGRGHRLEVAKELGADHCINFEETDDVVAAVRMITGGIGADQVIEAAGTQSAFMECIPMAKKNGHVAFITIPGEDGQMIAAKSLVMNQVTLHGVRANPNCSATVLRLAEQGRLNLKGLITHVFPIDQVHEAFDTFIHRKDGAVKVVIHPHG